MVRSIGEAAGQDGTASHCEIPSSFADIYPHYVAKAERKGHTRDEVDRVICWLTGYDSGGLERVLAEGTDLETFFDRAPAMNPDASLITGVICGHRVQEIEDPLMQKIRWMDLLVDEVARGKRMSAILRGSGSGSGSGGGGASSAEDGAQTRGAGESGA